MHGVAGMWPRMHGWLNVVHDSEASSVSRAGYPSPNLHFPSLILMVSHKPFAANPRAYDEHDTWRISIGLEKMCEASYGDELALEAGNVSVALSG